MPLLFERGSFRRKPLRALFLSALIIVVLFKLISSHRPVIAAPEGIAVVDHSKTKAEERGNAIVVASLKGDDVKWLKDVRPEWEKNIYIADDEERRGELRIPRNKGRESMVYLSFIIDNYNRLPNITIFIHSQRYQWHNDDPLYDGVPILQNFQPSHAYTEGYTNLRCCWTLGCPLELRPNHHIIESADPMTSKTATEISYRQAFTDLFPGLPVPDTIGVACCAQFAVSKPQILARPLKDYIHYRDWLLSTPLEDDVSGRIMEYSWHIIFGKKAVHCPPAAECYCKTFGYCNLTCNAGKGTCEGRYTLPKYSTLPKGWPEQGWR